MVIVAGQKKENNKHFGVAQKSAELQGQNLASKAMYLMSGCSQQFVCPYMVSGRSVAATRKTLRPASDCSAAGSGAVTSILISVYWP
jgi:hypothetical protein